MSTRIDHVAELQKLAFAAAEAWQNHQKLTPGQRARWGDVPLDVSLTIQRHIAARAWHRGVGLSS